MPLLLKVRSVLRNLFLSRRVEVDLDEELRSHLEMMIEENIRAGMQPKDALRAARIELGGIEQVNSIAYSLLPTINSISRCETNSTRRLSDNVYQSALLNNLFRHIDFGIRGYCVFRFLH